VKVSNVFELLGINKIVIASTNKGKIAQIKNFDVFKNIELLSASDFNLSDVEETEDTLEGNALLKARYCYQYTKMPSLSDDTGFFMNSLYGFPGIHCARIAEVSPGKRDFDMVAMVINEKLENNSDRSCRFSSAIALVMDGKEYVAKGDMPGTFVYPAMKGKAIDNGGYNPYFIPEYSNVTYAQSGITTEPIESHRSIAIQNLIKKMELSIS
jgi:XTP/dITP diphosphohydrolase